MPCIIILVVVSLSNCYISNMAVINLYLLYRLFVYRKVSFNDLDISKAKFIRYMSNIKFMLDEFHIYHISIIYDKLNECYILMGTL